MSPRTLSQLERLAERQIQLLHVPQIETHFALERDGFVILVQKHEGGFGGIGTAGMLTEHGFAPMLNGEFVAKQFRYRPTEAEVERMRRFSADLKEALE